MTPRKQENADHRRVRGIDGISRGQHVEDDLNEAVYNVFSTPAGEHVLNYLRSITLNRVGPPGETEGELREREGQRRLVAWLMARRETHELAMRKGTE